jgi:hypothetical protein
MADYYNDALTPRPDTHGEVAYPLDSTSLLAPYGDQHGDLSYPIDSAGDVHPQADQHTNEGFNLHRGQAKPGSFKD